MAHGRLTIVLALAVSSAAFAGCISNGSVTTAGTESPGRDYEVPEPDASIALLEHAELVDVPSHDIEIHARIVRPDVDEPVAVIVQFTPYTAPGRAMAVEPIISEPGGRFVEEFVRRGFAFAFADVRGTGDSGGCLDLRGKLDVEDAWALTEFLGTREWSNGKVGFIGASYPGSEAHIAAVANNPHLGGVIPVVASTSFYNYHHKAGVPYTNHLTTNAAYTQNAYMVTLNPQHENWVERQTTEPTECDTAEQIALALDGTGAYTDWWKERDLHWSVGNVEVPVLMAQGLADWNVKPDHIASYFNDLPVERKFLIAGQWGHAYPRDAEDAYGDWWALAAAFFDDTLRGADTGLFGAESSGAWVQGTDEAWRFYANEWPRRDARLMEWALTDDGLALNGRPSGKGSWRAEPASGVLDGELSSNERVILEGAFRSSVVVSGTPRLDLTFTSDVDDVHLVAVLEREDDGDWVRENYGYLNPTYRFGLDRPEPVEPGEPASVTIWMYPQEDVFERGTKFRLILRSVDEGRTVPTFDRGTIEVDFGGERPGVLWLPVSPFRP